MKHVLGSKSRTTLSDVQQGDSQPNAVDLRIDKVFRISSSLFIIDEEKKQHRGSFEVQPDGNGYWNLPEGRYEVVMQNVITVGENEAGWVITRSTLNRNGVFLTSGLYDTGYNGVMAGLMHVTCGPMRIQRGTRIGQYLSFDAESLAKYDGSYGLGKEHDKKYGEEPEAKPVPVTKSTGRPDLRKTDMSVEELSKIPKSKLNWHQIKKVNKWRREKEAAVRAEIEARAREERERLEAQKKAQEEAHRRDSLQAVATHIVTPGKAE
jgi:deoxycytidine triphosphate deaminase